jgi:hypothetical protein
MALSGAVYWHDGPGHGLSLRAAEALTRGCKDVTHSKREDTGVPVWECMASHGWALHDLIGLHQHHPYQMLLWDKRGHPTGHRTEPLQGYINQLLYHHMSAKEIARMHDDVCTHGMLQLCSTWNPQVPRIIHQFWERGRQQL